MSAERIKSWPTKERPRERLLAEGPERLTDADLLAIILRIGSGTFRHRFHRLRMDTVLRFFNQVDLSWFSDIGQKRQCKKPQGSIRNAPRRDLQPILVNHLEVTMSILGALYCLDHVEIGQGRRDCRVTIEKREQANMEPGQQTGAWLGMGQ